jgi:sedoheptulokinase
MACELYELFEVIREGTGITAAQLVASGNGLRKNKVLQEIFETFFGAELALAPYEEEAACGAAVSSMEKA